MKVLFIADARSPIARNWITYFIQRGHEVHVVSSYPISADTLPGAILYEAFLGFSGISELRSENVNSGVATGPDGSVFSADRYTAIKKLRNLLVKLLRKMRAGPLAWSLEFVRSNLAPIQLYSQTRKVREIIEDVSPDLVHAMRIPFEGLLGAKAVPVNYPLLISVWGNDFTLFAKNYPLVKVQTKQAMRQVSALHCDCHRDLRLARTFGFSRHKASIVLPGGGGIQSDTFFPEDDGWKLRAELNIPVDAPVIINPRGFRAYVRNDLFFRAIPSVLQERPNAIFLCVALADNADAEKWVEQLGIADNVRLLPSVNRERMADLFRLAQVTVSFSMHDGTPNTLLEGMACGCFPVAGDIESVREWITNGVNGLLCNPTKADQLARALIRAVRDSNMREEAKKINLKLIAERAEYNNVMTQAERFYLTLIKAKHNIR